MWVNQTSGILSHWFMPYKVERGKSSFQCGIKNSSQGNQTKKAKVKGKNSWYLQYYLIEVVKE